MPPPTTTSSATAHVAHDGPASPTPLAAALARVRSADDFPAVSERIHQLMDLLRDEDASVQRLAGFVLEDYSLTVKVLRMANSFRYNRSGAAIMSVTHAIVMMGVATVRDLVSSIIVLEHCRRRSPGLRELLMLSLLSASHAHEIAERTGELRGEEAYLLGLLRNLGEVLVACYLPAEYAAVLKDMAEHACPADVSCPRVLGFSYDELAAAVVHDWHLGHVEAILSDSPARSGPGAAHTIVSFGHALTGAVYRQSPDQSRDTVGLLVQKYSSLGLDRDDIGEVLEAALTATRETFAYARVTVDELQLRHQIAMAMRNPVDAPDPPSAPAPAAPAIVPPPPSAAGQPIEKSVVRPNELIVAILETALATGGFDRVLLALVSPAGQEVCGQFALGRDGDELRGRFRFPLGVRGGPVGLAIGRGQELIIASKSELLREEQRVLKTLGAGAIAILPLTIHRHPIGALYVDMRRSARLGERALGVARQMRDAIAIAIAREGPEGAIHHATGSARVAP